MTDAIATVPWFHGEVWAFEPQRLRAFLASMPSLPEVGAAKIAEWSALRADAAEGDWPMGMPRYAVSADGVASVRVRGPLVPWDEFMAWLIGGTSYRSIVRNVQAARDDGRVREVCLDVDSPGGFLSGIDAPTSAVLAVRGVKPIVARIDGLCCSAAYWIASAADRIEASPPSFIGCLGVVQTHYDTTRLLEKFGVDKIDFVSSQTPKKRPDPKQDDGKAQIQRQVDAAADVFLRAVAEHRGVTLEAVLADFGQGETLIASDAIAAGLADDIRARPDVVARRATPDPTTAYASADATHDDHEAPALGRMEGAMSGTRTEQPDAAATEAQARVKELERQLEAAHAAQSKADADLSAAREATEAQGRRLAQVEQKAYERERDALISAAVASNTIEPGEVAGWKKDADEAKAAGVEHLVFNRLQALKPGKALRTGSTGRAVGDQDQEGVDDDEPKAETASELTVRIKALVAESKGALTFTQAGQKLWAMDPKAFDDAFRNNPDSDDDRRAAR